MHEMEIDLWELYEQGFPCGITTNGCVKRNGEAVMGRGIALEANKRFPGLARRLGNLIKNHGSHVFVIEERLFSFPVKPAQGISNGHNTVRPFPAGALVPGWAMKADLELIRRSMEELEKLREAQGWDKVVLPRPGCGNGGLKWDEVRPIIDRPWLIVVRRNHV